MGFRAVPARADSRTDFGSVEQFEGAAKAIYRSSQGDPICCIEVTHALPQPTGAGEDMVNKALAAVIATLLLTAVGYGEDSTPPNAGGSRYSFHKVAHGFVRLDTTTGEVALCSRQVVGWACVAAPEDRAAYDSEIAHLRKENAVLKEDLLSRGLPLPAGAMPEPTTDDTGVTLRLPNDQDLSRVVAFVGHVWHRLIEAIANAQNQLVHKG
jgi:hypothetical protein